MNDWFRQRCARFGAAPAAEGGSVVGAALLLGALLAAATWIGGSILQEGSGSVAPAWTFPPTSPSAVAIASLSPAPTASPSPSPSSADGSATDGTALTDGTTIGSTGSEGGPAPTAAASAATQVPAISIPPLAQLPAAPLYYSGSSAAKTIAITIDDGFSASAVRSMLATLVREKVNATWFLIGRVVEANPSVWREVVAAGFPIANHTYSHANLPSHPYDWVVNDIKRSTAIIERLNALVSAGKLRNAAGQAVSAKLDSGLMRADGQALYPVRNGVPVLLVDEAITLD